MASSSEKRHCPVDRALHVDGSHIATISEERFKKSTLRGLLRASDELWRIYRASGEYILRKRDEGGYVLVALANLMAGTPYQARGGGIQAMVLEGRILVSWMLSRPAL
jgi:hypothetical protein